MNTGTFPLSRILQSPIVVIFAAFFVMTGCKPAATTEEIAKSAAPPSYSYGTVVAFNQGGDSELYRVSGWSVTEEKFTWTEGQAASLAMTIAAAETAVTLRMKLAGLTNAPDLPFQPVEVFANDQKIAEWQVAETADFTASIPADLTRAGGPLTINLKTPKAASPKALGTTADPRVIALTVFEFVLSQ